jgi:hypothetical protein
VWASAAATADEYRTHRVLCERNYSLGAGRPAPSAVVTRGRMSALPAPVRPSRSLIRPAARRTAGSPPNAASGSCRGRRSCVRAAQPSRSPRVPRYFPSNHLHPLALLRNSRKTERGAIGSWIDSGVRAAPFALLRNSRKTERGANQFLTHLAVRAAPFALLRNSPAQRSLARPDGPEFLAVPGAEPALSGLLSNSPQNGACVATRSQVLLSGIEGRDRPFAG